MPTERRNVEFPTRDGVILRGWFYPASKGGKAPTISMAHGFAGVKEMDLDIFAEVFAAAGLNVLVHDHRGFGDSDTLPKAPRQQVIWWEQISDWKDAITYAQSLPETDSMKIGIWGSSYAGGLAIQLAATDKRVQAVSAQIPMISGYATFRSNVRPEHIPHVLKMFEGERLSILAANPPTKIAACYKDHSIPACIVSEVAYAYTERTAINGKGKGHFLNEVTVLSNEQVLSFEPGRFIDLVAPCPLLMTVAEKDVECLTDLALDAYNRAKEPKQLNLLKDATHWDAYDGPYFSSISSTQRDFFVRSLLDIAKY